MKKLWILLALGALGMLADDGRVTDGDVSQVPEPASVVMMAAGLAGVAFMGWKRNKKK